VSKSLFNRFISSLLSSSSQFVRSGKGFNESQRNQPKVRKFMRDLAHFNINTLSDLINEQENVFKVEDFVDVNFISLNFSPFKDFSVSFRNFRS
jgi:hypothetical protein